MGVHTMGIIIKQPFNTVELLNDWYKAIISHDITKANKIKDDINSSVKIEDESQSVLLYYSLLKFRHNLIENDKSVILSIDPNHLDNQLRYYYYLFLAIQNTDLGKYQEALIQYKEAGNYLEHLIDEIEKAEYHYRISNFYYHLLQPITSIKHALIAKEIFESVEGYSLKVAGLNNIIGLNYINIASYHDAEHYFKQALFTVKSFGEENLEAMVYSNLGLLYSEQGISNKAIEYFNLTFEKQPSNFKNLFLLSRELKRTGQLDNIRTYISKGIELCKEQGVEEYIHHFNILLAKASNADNLEEVVIKGNFYFEKEGLFDYIEEYTSDLANTFFHENNFEKASIYFKMAFDTKEKKKVKGVI